MLAAARRGGLRWPGWWSSDVRAGPGLGRTGRAWPRSDLEPAGPTCSYEVDEGSGAAGYGTERVDWGLWPSRVCVTDSGEVFRGGAVDSTSPLQPDLFELENAPWWIGTVVVVLGLSAAAGGLVAWAVRR